MKSFLKQLLLPALLLCSFNSYSQYYYNPYQQQQLNQQAYEYGRRMAEQMMQQQINTDKQSVNGCFKHIGTAIARRDFVEAETWAEYLVDIDEKQGYFFLGLTNELQGYPQYARKYYKEGIEYGSPSCRQYLNRLNNEGELTDDQIDNVVLYYQQLEVMSYNMASQIMNNISSNSSYGSSSDSHRNHQSSGVCKRCNGTQVDPVLIDYNPGSRTKTSKIPAYVYCNYCQQKLSCDHWHQRCLDCSKY